MKLSQTRQSTYRAEVISQDNYPYIVSMIKDQENEIIAQGEWYYNAINGFNYLEYRDAEKPRVTEIIPFPPSLIEGQLMYYILNFLEDYIEIMNPNAIHFFLEHDGRLAKTPGMLFSRSWFSEEQFIRSMQKELLLEKRKLMNIKNIAHLNKYYPKFNQHLTEIPLTSNHVFFDSIHDIAYFFYDDENNRKGVEKYFRDMKGRVVLLKYHENAFKVQEIVVDQNIHDFNEFYETVTERIWQKKTKEKSMHHVLPKGSKEFLAFMDLYYEEDITVEI